MFGMKPRPAKPALQLREPRTPIPEGYEAEFKAISREAEWEHSAYGVGGAIEVLIREIVAMKARLDKLEALGEPVKEGGDAR